MEVHLEDLRETNTHTQVTHRSHTGHTVAKSAGNELTTDPSLDPATSRLLTDAPGDV